MRAKVRRGGDTTQAAWDTMLQSSDLQDSQLRASAWQDTYWLALLPDLRTELGISPHSGLLV